MAIVPVTNSFVLANVFLTHPRLPHSQKKWYPSLFFSLKIIPFCMAKADFSAQNVSFFMVKHWHFCPKWTPFYSIEYLYLKEKKTTTKTRANVCENNFYIQELTLYRYVWNIDQNYVLLSSSLLSWITNTNTKLVITLLYLAFTMSGFQWKLYKMVNYGPVHIQN